ncbi:MAG: prepilin-type N-terminal cleavage/methylation domain-containing protein [Candidatus Omnitrophota bacterium]|jgi:type IV pilus assembly protein PilA|nr:MAG: prepilin-type N-terminal cleavage/methylation domain-containing protein [Candidatus Omnitrophota bacterium]
MNKKGFTLLELVVVIIILGVLATLGIQQYGRMVERSRGAEARTILGQIRSAAAAYQLERGNTNGFNAVHAGIGNSIDQVPNACRTTHFFSYAVASTATTVTGTATRCTSGGKTPNAATALTLNLNSNFASGADTWGGTGGY